MEHRASFFFEAPHAFWQDRHAGSCPLRNMVPYGLADPRFPIHRHHGHHFAAPFAIRTDGGLFAIICRRKISAPVAIAAFIPRAYDPFAVDPLRRPQCNGFCSFTHVIINWILKLNSSMRLLICGTCRGSSPYGYSIMCVRESHRIPFRLSLYSRFLRRFFILSIIKQRLDRALLPYCYGLPFGAFPETAFA